MAMNANNGFKPAVHAPKQVSTLCAGVWHAMPLSIPLGLTQLAPILYLNKAFKAHVGELNCAISILHIVDFLEKQPMQFAHSTLEAADGTRLYTVSWMTDAPPKAAVVIAHGLAEHIHRYEHVAAFFADTHGFAVYGLDHRGHGKSEGLRTYFDSMEQPVEDLKRYVETIKPQHTKLFLYGHSMGSLISLLYALKYPNDFAGLIVTGCTVDVESAAPPPLVWVGRLLDRLIPKVHFLPLDSTGISTDPAVVQKYNNDPLVDRQPTRVHLAAEIGRNSTLVKQRMSEIKLPVLILHGGADKICPPSGSEALYAGVGSKDKTRQIYAGLYHEIHNEPHQQAILETMAAWMRER
jgi:lysophospholipase